MTKALTEVQPHEVAAIVGGSVAHGGITSQDLEVPRCRLLQKMSPDLDEDDSLKEGQFINSVTKEVVTGLVVPLFAFKQYASFDDDGKFEWGTVDRNDPRVQGGLEWVDNNPPAVTEFINIVVVDSQEIPMVLSYKSSALRAGKQFLTLLSLKGKAPYCFAYDLGSKKMSKDSKTWYVPNLKIPAKGHKVVDAKVVEYAGLAAAYKPIVTNIGVEGEAPAVADGEEAPF